jgi:hypothetical protein
MFFYLEPTTADNGALRVVPGSSYGCFLSRVFLLRCTITGDTAKIMIVQILQLKALRMAPGSHVFPLHQELGRFSDWWAEGGDTAQAPFGIRSVAEMPAVALEAEPGDLVRRRRSRGRPPPAAVPPASRALYARAAGAAGQWWLTGAAALGPL